MVLFCFIPSSVCISEVDSSSGNSSITVDDSSSTLTSDIDCIFLVVGFLSGSVISDLFSVSMVIISTILHSAFGSSCNNCVGVFRVVLEKGVKSSISSEMTK